MKTPLHILHLEDNPRDAVLVEATLEAEGICCATTCVQNRGEFVEALEHGGIDLVLSDFSLPTFDGLTAVEIVHARWPDLPVILVSGSLGEELAIDSLKSGATDYVLKERLGRLAPAVRRAMKEVKAQAENRQTKETLRETEERLRIVFDESPMGIALVGMDGHPLLTNAALQNMLGYTGEELRQMHFAAVTHPDDCAADQELYRQLMQGARKNYQMEKRYLRKDGQVVLARLLVNMAHGAAGNADFAIGMVEDITERRHLEAQFIEAQKMDVIGQLASGVAHDFNNILAVIMGYSDLLKGGLGADSPLLAYTEEIRHGSERAARLTHQLLVFSRKQTVQPVVLDLNAVVQDLEKMLRRLIGEHIAMTIVPGKETGRIRADSGYVGQVLMNLVLNARDAMPNGGTLTIATGNATLEKEGGQIRERVLTSPVTGNVRLEKDGVQAQAEAGVGDQAWLSVGDTGTGMTEKVKKHLFEAFFTTKPKGAGTGLGLATCRTIVQQCGGHISFTSEPGHGTTFKVYFPRVEQGVDALIQPIEAGPIARGTETLLLVEDDPSVRHLACSILEAQGYTVIRANNGQDALRTVQEHQGPPIRLVVTDVIMPLMNGKVMAEWLKETYPAIKILFTSGYTDDALSQHGVLEAGVAFLAKPYSPRTLAHRVRVMLDNETGPGITAGI